jgi:hypothetical protein
VSSFARDSHRRTRERQRGHDDGALRSDARELGNDLVAVRLERLFLPFVIR